MSDLERIPIDTDVDKLVEIVRRDGGFILEGLIDQSDIDSINRELEPHVSTRNPGFKDDFDDVFYGRNTLRIQGIPSKSPTFVERILLNSTLLGVADQILLPNCGDYWMSQAETIFIGPGEPQQQLHRDDINWGPAGELGIDLQISVLTALGDYDAEVGATMIIPGSHQWPLDKPIDYSLAQPVEMEPGSAVVYTGSVIHGGGHNKTSNRWRKGLYCSYLVGWLTPEEATALSLTPEAAERLPKRARELLGWSNLRGCTAKEGAAAALQLWQLDEGDLERYKGLFSHH